MAAPGRFELKYVVPEHVARQLAAQVQPYCKTDATGSLDGNYVVTSLYLDSPQWHLHQAVMTAQPVRFKARVRTYGSDPHADAWVEIKRRFGEVIAKSRARVRAHFWPTLVDRFALAQPDTWQLAQSALDVVKDFQSAVVATDLQPAMLVRYDREAYMGVLEPDVRVTFDRNLRYLRSHDAELVHDESRYHGMAGRDVFDGVPHAVVVELKFNLRMPLWMGDCVRTLQLHRGSFAKYSTAVELHREDGQMWARLGQRPRHLR